MGGNEYRGLLQIPFRKLQELLDLPEGIELTDDVRINFNIRSILIGIKSKEVIKGVTYEVADYSQLPYTYLRHLKGE